MSRYDDPIRTNDSRNHVPRYTMVGLGLPPWMGKALCAEVDNDLFFPEKGGTTAPAKAICARCPVSAECLDYALTHEERFGIWGGTSERERRKIAAALHQASQQQQQPLREETPA